MPTPALLPKPALLPQPTAVTWTNATLTLDAHATISASDPDAAIARRLLIPATGLALASAERGTIAIIRDERMPAEGYQLEVTPERVIITAADSRGVNWAVQTLRQLIGPDAFLPGPVGDAWEVPTVSIIDSPRFGWRAGHLDVGRHFMPVRDVLAHIDLLAMHKFNVFHFHLTEDQGWRFESKKYPRLTEVAAWRPETVNAYLGSDGTPHGGFYTQDQLRHVVAYAAERGITVVPEVEFPGHLTAVIAAYPELGVPGVPTPSVATGFGILTDVLNMSDAAMEFVFDVYAEVLDVFPSRWIHIGGDEVPRDQWRDSPEMSARAAELGLDSVEQLQDWFTARLHAWLTERGRVAIGWDEVADNGPVPGMILHAWRGSEKGVAAAHGMDVIMAPVGWTYFDYYQSTRTDEPYCIGSLTTTEKAYSFEPLDGFTPESAPRVLGVSFQLWSEYLPTRSAVEYMAWPRACATSEVAWSDPKGRSFEEFSTRLDAHLGRLAALGVNYRPETGPLPWQTGGTGLRRRPEKQAW
ncbi:MAG TPA: beta-N-acetylhexosaminidase [Propionibacteriaceae bacterium]|nr:beta-N-acetylhexosaminidase [Propionibacteriaceae bacterium]